MRLLKLPALQLVALWRLAVTATGDQVVAAGKAEEAEEAARAGANRGEAPRMEAVALLKRDPAGVTSAGAATTPGEGGEFGDLGAGRPLEARSSPRTSSAGVDRRWLGGQGIDGNTIGAHPAAGNPNPSCGSETSCINGCPSVFYRVLGTGANMTASTCPYNDYDSRIYVWEGDACANFKCVGTCVHANTLRSWLAWKVSRWISYGQSPTTIRALARRTPPQLVGIPRKTSSITSK